MATTKSDGQTDDKGNFRFSAEGTEYEIGRLTLIDLVECAAHLRNERQKVYDDALKLFAKMGAEAGELAKDAFRMRAEDVMLDPEEFFGWIRSPEGVVHLLKVGIEKTMPPVNTFSLNEEQTEQAFDNRKAEIQGIISKIGVDIINDWQMFLAKSFSTHRWERIQEAAEMLTELLHELPEELQEAVLTVSGFIQGTPTQTGM